LTTEMQIKKGIPDLVGAPTDHTEIGKAASRSPPFLSWAGRTYKMAAFHLATLAYYRWVSGYLPTAIIPTGPKVIKPFATQKTAQSFILQRLPS